MESTCSFSHLEGEHPIQIEVDLEATSQAPPPPSWHAEVFTGPQNKVSKNTTKPEAKPNLMVTPPPKTSGQPGTQDPTMHAEPLLLPGTDRKERKGSLPQMCPSTGFLKPQPSLRVSGPTQKSSHPHQLWEPAPIYRLRTALCPSGSLEGLKGTPSSEWKLMPRQRLASRNIVTTSQPYLPPSQMPQCRAQPSQPITVASKGPSDFKWQRVWPGPHLHLVLRFF